MNKVLKSTVAALGVALMFFLASAFVQANFDITSWTEGARFICVACMILFGGFTVFVMQQD